MVLHCSGIMTAGMGDVPLPVLLTVKSSTLYFPEFPAYARCLLSILICQTDTRCSLEIRSYSLSVYNLFFPKPQHVYQLPVIINIVYEFCMPCHFLFRDFLIFLRDASDASGLVTNDEFPAVILTDSHHRFRCIQTVCQQYDWQSQEGLLYFPGQPFTCFCFAVLFVLLFTQVFLALCILPVIFYKLTAYAYD